MKGTVKKSIFPLLVSSFMSACTTSGVTGGARSDLCDDVETFGSLQSEGRLFDDSVEVVGWREGKRLEHELGVEFLRGEVKSPTIADSHYCYHYGETSKNFGCYWLYPLERGASSGRASFQDEVFDEFAAILSQLKECPNLETKFILTELEDLETKRDWKRYVIEKWSNSSLSFLDTGTNFSSNKEFDTEVRLNAPGGMEGRAWKIKIDVYFR